MDTQGLLNAVFDPTTNSIRVSGSGDNFLLSPNQFQPSTGSPALSLVNAVSSYEFDAAVVEAITAHFVVPIFWTAINFDLYLGRRTAGSGNIRHRLTLKELASGDLVTEAALVDSSATVTPGVQNAVTRRADHVGAPTTVVSDRLYAVTYERTATDAADTYTLDSSFFGVTIRRGA